MKVFIRTDASFEIGSGHVMRCLSLAGALREQGADVVFLCRELPGNLCGMVEECGFAVVRLPATETKHFSDDGLAHAAWLGVEWQTDAQQCIRALQQRADWLVVDHYAIDAKWESSLQRTSDRMMVVDDLADRHHQCDLLLDQNLQLTAHARYADKVPRECRLLLGPSYALLRPEFSAARRSLPERRGRVERILVFFGASDAANHTSRAVQAFRQLARIDMSLDVIIGVNNPWRSGIEHLVRATPRATCHGYVSNMAALTAASDLYIGAAGTTTWERCCLGLPSLVVTVAENQVGAIADLATIGAVQVIGHGDAVTADVIAEAMKAAVDDIERLKKYSRASMALVDGRGAERCAETMFEISRND